MGNFLVFVIGLGALYLGVLLLTTYKGFKESISLDKSLACAGFCRGLTFSCLVDVIGFLLVILENGVVVGREPERFLRGCFVTGVEVILVSEALVYVCFSLCLLVRGGAKQHVAFS